MEKNRLYTIVFALLFVLVILLGSFNLLSGSKNNQSTVVPEDVPTPTTNFLFPTRQSNTPNPSMPSNPSTSISPSPTILELAYPLKYENLIIDYISSRKQIVILYPQDQAKAQTIFQKFLDQYQTTGKDLVGTSVDYIGLTRDPNEPPPGKMLQ